MPNIRTVTAFVGLKPHDRKQWRSYLADAVTVLAEARRQLEEIYCVQTLRIATSPFESYADCTSNETLCDDVDFILRAIETSAESEDAILVNIGPARTAHGCKLLPNVLKRFSNVTASVLVPCVDAFDPQKEAHISVPSFVDSSSSLNFTSSNPFDTSTLYVPNTQLALEAAQIIRDLGTNTDGGTGNFNFAALCNCPPGIPFFPAAYAADFNAACQAEESSRNPNITFAIGLEIPDVIIEECENASELFDQLRNRDSECEPNIFSIAGQILSRRLRSEFSRVQHAAIHTSKVANVTYTGIDSSIAPSPQAPSLTTAFEAIGKKLCGESYRFGHAGSVAIAALLTRALQCVQKHDILLRGYCGLMLPPLEDVGLASHSAQQLYGVTELLTYSSVCGLGLDTVPIAGNTSAEEISCIIADVSAMAYRLQKPLSCRLFPVPGVGIGENTNISHPHLCDAVVFDL